MKKLLLALIAGAALLALIAATSTIRNGTVTMKFDISSWAAAGPIKLYIAKDNYPTAPGCVADGHCSPNMGLVPPDYTLLPNETQQRTQGPSVTVTFPTSRIGGLTAFYYTAATIHDGQEYFLSSFYAPYPAH